MSSNLKITLIVFMDCDLKRYCKPVDLHKSIILIEVAIEYDLFYS